MKLKHLALLAAIFASSTAFATSRNEITPISALLSMSGLAKAVPGLTVAHVPKTIDNDVTGTQRSFGFDSDLARGPLRERQDLVRGLAA